MKNPESVYESALADAEAGLNLHLLSKLRANALKEQDYEKASGNVISNLRKWLLDPTIETLSPNLKPALCAAISAQRWEDLVNAFVKEVEFGTGGIRALMAFDFESVVRLQHDGIDAAIIKGPNTINNIVVLKAAYGVARFLVESKDYVGKAGEPHVVVGFDSRVRGSSFAKAVTELLLAQEGVHVHLFDEPVPYPEVTYAIPRLGADAGIFISASHNDYRYNGFKMSAANGAQFPAERRAAVIAHILRASPDKLVRSALEAAGEEALARLHFLGGKEPLTGTEYYGRSADLRDIHTEHVDHIQSFLQRKDDKGQLLGGADLKIVYAAFNGSGRRAVPRILREIGCPQVHSIRSLDPLDGLFPAFDHRAGFEQQPDPGDPRSAEVALAELDKDASEPGAILWADADLLIGTDPDADRCGVIVKPPLDLAKLLKTHPSVRATEKHVLIPADDMWALILWYRLQFEREQFGAIPRAEEKFIALSHTTSDMIAMLAKKNGLGVLKTWVGFGWLASGVSEAWKGAGLPLINEGLPPRSPKPGEPTGQCDLVFTDTRYMNPQRTYNVATLEQSNGFSILGSPPIAPERSLGIDGHVRDKDGTFASLLITEVAAYAKRVGTDLLSLAADHLYCDPDVGLFVNYYEPDPIDGEFPGLEGTSKKRGILEATVSLYERARAGDLDVVGRRVTHAVKYHTGKYDVANDWVGTAANGWNGFPDEGIRFYLGSDMDHITIRPSGTTNSLRFHVQLFGGPAARESVWPHRLDLEQQARALVDTMRGMVGAPRAPGARI